MYVVQLEENCWLGNWQGDPPRTGDLNMARLFFISIQAERALKKARKYRPLKNAKIIEVEIKIKE